MTRSQFASEYYQKLKDPRWQKKRLQIMERDNFTCQSGGCGSTTDTLNVHHKFYESGKDPWDYDGNVLVTLCENCHKEEEQCKDSAMKWLHRAFARAGFLNHQIEIFAEQIEASPATGLKPYALQYLIQQIAASPDIIKRIVEMCEEEKRKDVGSDFEF